jgi:hypothetical protein
MNVGGIKKIFSRILGLSVLSVLILSFQNCSDFALDADATNGAFIFESQMALDAEGIPRLTTATTLQFWSKPGAPSYVLKSPAFFDQGAVIAMFDRTMTGRVIVVQTADAKTEEMAIDIVGGKVRATHYTDPSNYAYVESALPSSGSKVVVAARFGTSVSDISLLLNGIVQTAPIVKVGVPGDYGYVSKTPAVGSTGGAVTEYAVYNAGLPNTDLNVMARYIAGQYNLSYVIFDPSLANSGGGGGTTTGPSAEFKAAKNIIDNSCLSCHNGSTAIDFNGWDEAKFIRLGYAVAGNPESSKVYYRLVGSTGSNGPKNMGSLSASQVATIATWINSIK